jgi:flagellar basal-body rod protein FlgF/flagellar basal-body rod protein FlgG
MQSGSYAAYAGLLARTQALDVAASNLSNSSTAGFRAGREYFRSAILGPDALNSQLGRTVNDFGVLGGDQLNLGEGAIRRTGNALDAAVEGPGFFAVQTTNGVRYTRDGSFHLSSSGQLVTDAGEPVLDQQLKPILLPPGEPTIGSDGAISIAGGTAATIGLWEFSSGAQLKAEGVNRYAAVAGAAPTAAKNSTLLGGALEGSNEDVVTGTMNLVLMQRQTEMMQKALGLFHNEMDKSAAETLPKA